jgi:hypothetical protein
MKVKFLVSIASADWAYAPGQIAELDADLAEKWIASGICQAMEEPKAAAPKPSAKRK